MIRRVKPECTRASRDIALLQEHRIAVRVEHLRFNEHFHELPLVRVNAAPEGARHAYALGRVRADMMLAVNEAANETLFQQHADALVLFIHMRDRVVHYIRAQPDKMSVDERDDRLGVLSLLPSDPENRARTSGLARQPFVVAADCRGEVFVSR